MWLITENPWPLILVFSIISSILILAGYAQQRAYPFIGVALLLILSGAVLVIEDRIVTDKERVEAAIVEFTSTFQRESKIYNLASVLQAGEVPKTLSFISKNAKGIQMLALQSLVLVAVEDDVRITDVTVTMRSRNSRAVTHFRANATISVPLGDMGRKPSRWEMTWQREGDEWKVIKVRRLDVMTGDEIDVFDKHD